MTTNKIIYNVGLYIRLSKEDENKQNKLDESESVKNQREFLESFLKKRNETNENEIFKICDEYIDDGFSGTNTKDRAFFNKMIEDIKKGKINCIIVKDLSRFARNNADQTYYLNNFFPKHKTRFIAVLEGYDNVNAIYSEIAEIMGFLNENRSRNMSKNIKNIFKVKAEKGEFIGAFTSYGYKRDPENKNHFVIDEEAANVVRRIFSLYLNGNGQITIANILNKENVPTPSEYKRQKGLNYKNSKERLVNQWTYSTVHRILKNKMLVGDMWQKRNKRGKFDHGSSQYSEEENIIVANTHEAIIDREKFELVQNKLKNNRDVSKNLKNNVSIYAKHLRCECGHPMAKITNKYKNKTVIRYVCRAYKQGAGTCSAHTVLERDLNKAVLQFLNDCICKIKKKDEIICKAAKSKNKKQDIILKQLKSTERELIATQNKKKRLLDLYLDNGIEKDEYLSRKAKFEHSEEFLKEKIENLSKDNPKTEEELFLADTLIKELLNIGKFKSLSKEIIDTFIKQIIVSKDNSDEITLEIIPTFRDPEA